MIHNHNSHMSGKSEKNFFCQEEKAMNDRGKQSVEFQKIPAIFLDMVNEYSKNLSAKIYEEKRKSVLPGQIE